MEEEKQILLRMAMTASADQTLTKNADRNAKGKKKKERKKLKKVYKSLKPSH